MPLNSTTVATPTEAADERALAELPAENRILGETDSRQVFDRLAGTWTYWGWKGGYFDSDNDAQAFFDEQPLVGADQQGIDQRL